MTNIQMKFSISIAWLFLAAFRISSAAADISLALNSKQYLPPPIQELPINEAHLNAQPQNKLKEHSYDNSRYQIFGVHSQYEASSGGGRKQENSLPKQLSFPNNNYMPLSKDLAEKIIYERINGPADFPLDDPNLDVSYLGFAVGKDDNEQQQIVQHETNNDLPVQFPSNFRHSFPEKPQTAAPLSFSSMQQYNGQKHDGLKFRGPAYLPPKLQAQQYFTQSEQKPLPAQDSIGKTAIVQDYSSHQIFNNNVEDFKGLNFLPPQHHLPSQTHSNLEPTSILKSSKYERYNEPGNSQFEHNFIGNPQYKAPDYLPPSQGTKQQQLNKPFRPSEQFKGPDYLPPENSQVINNQQNTLFRNPDNLQTQYENKSLKNVPFKGPDYLPPHPSQIKASYQGSEYSLPVRNQVQPPIQQQSQNLPDGYDFKKPLNAQQVAEELHKLPEESQVPQLHSTEHDESSNENYDTAKQAETSDSNNANLAVGDDFEKPENSEQALKLLHSEKASSAISSEVSIPGTPVYHFQRSSGTSNIENQLQHSDSPQQQFHPEADDAANNLESAYDTQKPANAQGAVNGIQGQQIFYENNQLQATQSRSIYSTEAQHLAPNQATNQATSFVSQPEVTQFTQSSQQSFKAPDYLPPPTSFRNFKGSDYLPPASGHLSEEHILSKNGSPASAVFKGPDYLPPASSSQNNKGPDFSTSIGFQAEIGSKVLKSPGHLPPSVQHIASKNGLNFAPAAPVFKGPDYLPPASSSQNNKSPDFSTSIRSQGEEGSKLLKGPNHLPPVNQQPSLQLISNNQVKGPAAGQKTIAMHPLSSYMTNIKPYDRYGNRRPFSEYGSSPATTTTFSNSKDVAPMYRQPTAKPNCYAPNMSYSTVPLNSQITNQHQPAATLSLQARQALQTFMPEEIRQAPPTNHFHAPITPSKIPTTVQAVEPAKTKIRTVQIVNPHAIKTLKVLESLDNAGVKTIKILGSSNELPKGEHRVVKVVSGGNEQNVQTVKIFNDHQDFVADGNIANSYLPARSKRNPTSSTYT